MRQAGTASLNHGAAGLVARRAADAAAVLGVFALANADREIALAHANAVEGAGTTAEAVCQHAAEVLQRAAGDFIFAAAMNLAAASTFLEFDAATW